jgi:hypothetical protein
MVDSGLETDFWWLEWIIRTKIDVQIKDSALIDTSWWAKYGAQPFE